MNQVYLHSFVSAVVLTAVFSGHNARTQTVQQAAVHRPPNRSPTHGVSHHTAPAHQMASSQPETLAVHVSRHARDGGGGMMRIETEPHAVQSVGKQYIDMRSPTSTGLDLIQNLPSVSIAMPDTSGIKGGSIFIRGFTDADMGLMLDGAPASLAAYLQQNVDSENIESVNVTPGSSQVDMPTANASAGALDERTITPSAKRGGAMDFSYGTNNMSREFIRLQSGYIGHSGVRTYASFSNTHSRQWMGGGINQREHVDFGLQKDFNNGSYIKLFTSWNNSMFTIDNYATAAQFYNYKHTGEGFNRTASWNPTAANAGDYWKSNLDSWNQFFVSAPVHVVINRRLDLDVTSYLSTGFGWDGSSAGTVGTTGACANGCKYGNGTPAASGQQLSTYYAQGWSPDVGVVAKLSYKLDRHNHLTFGYWYENNAVSEFSPTMATMASGRNPKTDNAEQMLYNMQGQKLVSTDHAGYELNSFFIQDSAKYLHDRLTVNAGFKYVMSNYWDRSSGLLGSGTRLGENTTAPLPHLAVAYRFNQHHQIYMNAEGDFRQPLPSALPAGMATLPKDQYSITEQLGYRFNNKWLIADVSVFNSNITNRLLSVYLPTTQYATVNAGNETVRGIDAMIAGRQFHHFSPYASVEYLYGRMDSNIAYGNSYLPTKGKQAIATPRVMANFGLTYANEGFFGNFSLHYTGPQSVTMVGDERMPGFVTDTLALGYHFHPISFMKTPTFRLNFTNLTGSIVRVGTTGVAYNMHDVTLLNGQTAAGGGGANFYVMPRFSMTGTISTDF